MAIPNKAITERAGLLKICLTFPCNEHEDPVSTSHDEGDSMLDMERLSCSPLIDGHAHLAQIADYREALSDAREAGVAAVVAVGMDLESNRQTLRIAAEFRNYVLPALGYHPWSVRREEKTETLAHLEKHIKEAAAIGEVGLDFKTDVDRSLQEEVLADVIAIARHHDKTLILHGLHAYPKVFSLVRGQQIKKAVFHWYADSLMQLRDIIQAGYFISATPALTYSGPHQAAIREAPLERIILETDCPVTYRDVVSRPRDTLIALREVARLKGLTLAEVAQRTFRNTEELFGISDLLPPESSDALSKP
jgi:TatD DNase family protein